MRIINCNLILILFIVSMGSTLACTDMQVLPAQPKQGSVITVTCTTDVEVKQIAVEILGENWNGSFPNLFDDGTHGDKVSHDNVYALTIETPPVSGTYQVKFFRILPDQTELQAAPLTFKVQ
jgi:hypothetical protein